MDVRRLRAEEAVVVRSVVRWTVVVLLSVHAVIHLLGAAKGFGWAEVDALRSPIGPAVASGWLLAALLVLATAVMVAVGAPTWWWAVGVTASLVSQAVIMTSWTDAKAGTIANVLLALVAAYGFLSLGPASFAAEWQHRTHAALEALGPAEGVVTESDLARVPALVADYVRRSGAVGRPRVSTMYAEIHGRIRGGPDEPWMPFSGHQLNTYGTTPQRLFYLDATMRGLPVTVFHVFDDKGATMRAKLVSVIAVLDSEGPEMDRSETVTLFNDMVVLAPGALVDAPVQWTELGQDRVRAAYTRADQTVTAELVFSPEGDLLDFTSRDRSRASTDGRSFARLPWNTPLTRYREIRGRRTVVEGTAMWDAPAPEGHFTYIDFHVDDLACNVTTPKIPDRPPHQNATFAR